jgi:AraC family transcriptional regulator
VAIEQIDGCADRLTSLALDLGFSSHSHFTRAFREFYGCPPSALL